VQNGHHGLGKVPLVRIHRVHKTICVPLSPHGSMFVESFLSGLVAYHAGAVSLPQADVIFGQLACNLNYIIFVYMGSN
jgi:hypothetical protein